MSLLFRMGADTQRMIDGRGMEVGRYAAHLARIGALRLPGSLPLVVLTRTSPFAASILQVRRVLEASVPPLACAAWIVFHDELADTAFPDIARTFGELDRELELGPIWCLPAGGRFLVLGNHPRQLDFVQARLATLELALSL